MSHNLRNVLNAMRWHKGFSLVELLIALGVSAVLCLVLAQWHSQVIARSLKQQEFLHLQQHAQQMLAYMQKHVQYLGFVAKSRQGSNDILFRQQGRAYSLTPNCLLFFYDVNRDGCIGKAFGKQGFCQQAGMNQATEIVKEFFGFKFQSPHLLIFAHDIKCTHQQECQQWANYCYSNAYWDNATDLVDYQLDELHFDWLKVEQILRIRLRLRSSHYPEVYYETQAYHYILNTPRAL